MADKYEIEIEVSAEGAAALESVDETAGAVEKQFAAINSQLNQMVKHIGATGGKMAKLSTEGPSGIADITDLGRSLAGVDKHFIQWENMKEAVSPYEDLIIESGGKETGALKDMLSMGKTPEGVDVWDVLGKQAAAEKTIGSPSLNAAAFPHLLLHLLYAILFEFKLEPEYEEVEMTPDLISEAEAREWMAGGVTLEDLAARENELTKAKYLYEENRIREFYKVLKALEPEGATNWGYPGVLAELREIGNARGTLKEALGIESKKLSVPTEVPSEFLLYSPEYYWEWAEPQQPPEDLPPEFWRFWKPSYELPPFPSDGLPQYEPRTDPRKRSWGFVHKAQPPLQYAAIKGWPLPQETERLKEYFRKEKLKDELLRDLGEGARVEPSLSPEDFVYPGGYPVAALPGAYGSEGGAGGAGQKITIHQTFERDSIKITTTSLDADGFTDLMGTVAQKEAETVETV